jgi:VIT1/CCC1 family predicted Fe2+/Mn2+ transporter
MKKIHVLYFAAAAATAIGGIIHVILSFNSLQNNVNTGILFLVGGIAQMFWVIPMIRRWGAIWYSIGIGGTATFMAIWVITRLPDNPITGRAGSVSQNAIIVETAQIAFIALAIAILVYEYRRKPTV